MTAFLKSLASVLIPRILQAGAEVAVEEATAEREEREKQLPEGETDREDLAVAKGAERVAKAFKRSVDEAVESQKDRPV